MEIIKRLQLEIDKGFSKSELERIVDLPLNTLSSILTGKKKMTAKHILSVSTFLDNNPNLNPLNYPKRTRTLKEPKKERQEKHFPPPPDKKARQKKTDSAKSEKDKFLDNPLEKQMPRGLSLMQQLEWREKNGQ